MILLAAAQSIQAETFTLGDFALFNYYLSYVTGIILGLGSWLIMY